MSHYILGLRVDVTSYEDSGREILAWAREPAGRTVCCANVHMVMEAHRDASFRGAVNGADRVTADGMPLVWTQWRSGAPHARRVYGPDLMRRVLAMAAETRTPVGFLGATHETLARLASQCQSLYPGLELVYAYAPPFRVLDSSEEDEIVRQIEASGTRILFVGLGCPKQERWMARHRGRLRCVQVGVGAAFDQLAGVTPRAPAWMQAVGCEWLFRMAVEPRRLWRRYLWTNSAFVFGILAAWLRGQSLARRHG